MKPINFVLSVLFLIGTLGLNTGPVLGAESGATKVVSREGDYCHMKFPAIREETLSWDRPALKDWSSGDIIDFYGPCNYDPLGRAEIQAQRLRWQRLIGSGNDG